MDPYSQQNTYSCVYSTSVHWVVTCKRKLTISNFRTKYIRLGSLYSKAGALELSAAHHKSVIKPRLNGDVMARLSRDLT